MSSLVDTTRKAILSIYESQGLRAADAKILTLLKQCEDSKVNARDRSTIKGELSEMALECHLRYWTEKIPNLAYTKGLCIHSKHSNATAEIDLLLVTPCRIYLFECKSFKGSKTLTDKCFLKGGSSSKDVYEQSRYHLEILEQHLAEFRSSVELKVSPYQLLLFELSSDSVEDLREPKWKSNIPLLTMGTIDRWLLTELGSHKVVRWNLAGVVTQLRKLNATSEQMFKFHMAKITNRKGNK